MTELTATLARAPRINIQYEDFGMQAPVEIRTAWCAGETGSGTDFVIATGNTSFLQLPVAFLAYPKLQFHGYLWWVITADYTQVGANQTIELQLVQNGSAIGSAMSFGPAAAFAGTGAIVIDAKMYVFGNMTGSDRQLLDVTFSVVDAAGAATMVTGSAKQFYTISQEADQDIGFQIRKTSAVPNPNVLDLRSFNCLHIGSRSGS